MRSNFCRLRDLGVTMEADSSTILSPDLTIHTIATKLDLQLNLTDNFKPIVEQADPEESEIEEQDDDCDFSFVCAEASSPISADDLFDNGQIKPILPWLENFSATEPLKVFVEAEDDVVEGPYCAWSERMASAGESTSSCRKSNSTGFSKLRRFRELLHRSQSDGKDTFVFLTRSEKEETTSSSSLHSKKDKTKKASSKKGKAESKTTSSTKSKTTPSMSSYALQYGEKGKEKRKSYLPYRQDLVGFFTNASSMSKNIHPY